MTQEQRKTVKVLAEQNMNVSKTARALYCHRNTIIFRIERIQKKTGLNPLNFFDLHELYQIVTSGEETLDKPRIEEE